MKQSPTSSEKKNNLKKLRDFFLKENIQTQQAKQTLEEQSFPGRWQSYRNHLKIKNDQDRTQGWHHSSQFVTQLGQQRKRQKTKRVQSLTSQSNSAYIECQRKRQRKEKILQKRKQITSRRACTKNIVTLQSTERQMPSFRITSYQQQQKGFFSIVHSSYQQFIKQKKHQKRQSALRQKIKPVNLKLKQMKNKQIKIQRLSGISCYPLNFQSFQSVTQEIEKKLSERKKPKLQINLVKKQNRSRAIASSLPIEIKKL